MAGLGAQPDLDRVLSSAYRRRLETISRQMEVIRSMSKVRLVLLSMLAALAASAAVTATASAGMPAYTTPAGGLIAGLLLILSLTRNNARLTSKLAGVNIEITCTHKHTVGWIHNSINGDALGLVLAHYLECTMPKPAAGNCKIKNGLIHVHSRVLLLLNGKGGYKEEYTPAEGSNKFALIGVEGCNNSALNGEFEVTGTAVAEVNNTTLELEFTETSGSNLKLGANAAQYIDTVKPLMEGTTEGIMVENGF
jgi:hypothetical protein